MMPIFAAAVPVLEKIEAAGFEAYFVGGSVRDYILGKEVADVDIATSATPQEIKRIFPKTVDVGIEHGTVVVLWGKETYEVTTFRSESEYVDFRRPSEVFFIRSLEEDLKRRDFTMNSIAMDKAGRLIDPFAGREAIGNKLIVTVGSATERFHEDALRMMRAVRFMSQLSFVIDGNTCQALREHASLLEKIAVERKTAEFEKLLQGENRKHAIETLIDTSLYLYLPGLSGHKAALLRMLQYKLTPLSLTEMWGLLLYMLNINPEKAEIFLRQWKLPVKKIKLIKEILLWLHYRFTASWTDEALFDAKLEQAVHSQKLHNILNDLPVSNQVQEIKRQYEALPIKDRHELAVGGYDVMEWEGRKGGQWVKEKLALIEKAVLYEKVKNEKESIKEWLKKCNQS